MKKIILCAVAILLVLSEASAQNSRTRGKKGKYQAKHCQIIGIGGNYALPTATGFDDMLKEFNQKYATTSGTFTTATPFMGGSLLYTSYGNHGESRAKMWYEFGLHGMLRTMQATEKISQKVNKIDQQIYDVHVGIGALPVQTKSFDLALALTGEGGVLRTQANGTNSTQLAYSLSQDDFFFSATAQMPIYIYFGEHISLGIRPYYQFQLNSLSFKGIRNVMNFDAVSGLPTQDKDITLSKFSNYGVFAHINIAFQKVKDIRR